MIVFIALILLLFQIFLFTNSWYITALQFIYNRYNNIHSLYLSFILLLFIIYSSILQSDIIFRSQYSNILYVDFLISIVSLSIFIYVSYIAQFNKFNRFLEFIIKNQLIGTIIILILLNNIINDFYVLCQLLQIDLIIITLIKIKFEISKKLTIIIYLKWQIGSIYILYKTINILLNQTLTICFSVFLIILYQILEYLYIYYQIKKNKLI